VIHTTLLTLLLPPGKRERSLLGEWKAIVLHFLCQFATNDANCCCLLPNQLMGSLSFFHRPSHILSMLGKETGLCWENVAIFVSICYKRCQLLSPVALCNNIYLYCRGEAQTPPGNNVVYLAISSLLDATEPCKQTMLQTRRLRYVRFGRPFG
jgi:hypothetical protein